MWCLDGVCGAVITQGAVTILIGMFNVQLHMYSSRADTIQGVVFNSRKYGISRGHSEGHEHGMWYKIQSGSYILHMVSIIM